MPIYEYGCEACGHHMEALQKISDAHLVTCPECGKDSLSRQVSHSSFSLKGGGWYADGYSGGTKGSAAKSSSSSESSSSSDSSSASSSSASESKSSSTKSSSSDSSS